MSAELTELTLEAALKGLRDKEFSAREVTEAHLQAVHEADALNAFLHISEEEALEAAEHADRRYAEGEAKPLDGIPLAIKDMFCTQNAPTTAGSRMLEGFSPPYESTVTARLREAGAVMLGKTNMDEFAMGSSNENSAFGPCLNPWRSQQTESPLTPGGSSGGSAAAVAARLCFGATGSDTGGSIRQPAAFTGLVGFKPGYGRCSRFGMVAFSSSLDQAGPLTRRVKDAALMLEVMAGHDPQDSTSPDLEVPLFSAACGRSVRGLKIGLPKEYRLAGLSEEILKLWDQGLAWLREAGCEIVDVSLPHTSYALPTYYIIAPAEASSNLARYDGMRYGLRAEGEDLTQVYEQTRGQGFGAEVRRRVLVGTYVLSAGYYDAYYVKAQKVRRRIAQDFKEVFQKVDALLTPSAPSAAFPLGEKTQDSLAMYMNDVFTVPASLAGLPAASVPAALNTEGLPLGLQVIGRSFDEETVFALSTALEKAAGFKQKPSLWWRQA